MNTAVFAIPGDKDRRTGGFIYEATVLRVLNEIGCDVRHVQLPDTFPAPTAPDMAETLRVLRAIPPQTPILLDGLVFGAIDPGGLAQVSAPVIAMLHHPLGLEAGLPPERAAFLRANERAALVHAAHVVVTSPETKRLYVAEFGVEPERITVVLPGFDRPLVDRRVADPPLILSVGLLAPRKGHDVLLKALAQMVDLPWQARIVGKAHDPDFAAALVSSQAELGLENRVTFAGELARLEPEFNAATIFALATRYEGYGMVLSEAMFYGLPIVTCRVGAVPDTAADAALLVGAEDAEGFAAALRAVLTQPALAQDLSARALRRAATLPRWEDSARAVAGVIERVRG
ncbi:MAG: glycosyltransferase family 4 protein [Pseudomonadota bacterium]